MKKSEVLLDAHVRWLSQRIQGDGLAEEVALQLDGFLDDVRKVRLKDVIKPATIHATVKKYAVDLKLGGVMPELVGDIVRDLYKHKIHDKTKLHDLLPDRLFNELLDKLLEFKDLREAAIREAVRNPIFSSLIADVLYQGISDYLASSTKAAERLPGAKSALALGKAVLSRSSPTLGSSLSDGLKAYVQKNTQSSMRASERHLHQTFESDEFRQVMLDLWEDGKEHRVADAKAYVDSLDLEELFVILYDYWQQLRRTTFFTTVVNAGIDTVLKKFGDMDLATLLEEIGITREMMIDDAMRFAPPVIAFLQKKEMLEPALRRVLGGFYASEEAQRLLDA